MSLKAVYQPYTLYFRFEAGTSRGVMTEKTSWMIKLFDDQQPLLYGVGECGPLKGLSLDDHPNFEEKLKTICKELNTLDLELFAWNVPIILDQFIGSKWPSIRFGFETAMFDYINGCRRELFSNQFTAGVESIPINGLIWMGDHDFMLRQVEEKIQAGFGTIKVKVGAIDFEQECAVLRHIRQHFGAHEITLRVDANGAFDASNVYEKLNRLAEFDLHSIEQPVRAGQLELMTKLCTVSPIPVALDEELIGSFDYVQKRQLLKQIMPPFIILKPTLLGGFTQTREWIETAQRLGIEWWVTSALESNIGLNAIAQFTAEYQNPLPQGLGTGQLYYNNLESPLEISNGQLHFNPHKSWYLEALNPVVSVQNG